MFMLRLLPGTLCIALTFLILATTFVGIGLGARRAFGLVDIGSDDLFIAFWIGFSFVLLLLLFWNFVLPVDGRTLSVVMSGGVLGLFVVRRHLAVAIRDARGTVPRRAWLLVGIALLWVANLSSGAMTNWDSSLYHMQGVEWARNYPAVPGVANVFGPLGYNNASFLYDALLGSGPWFGRGWHVAAGLLVFVICAQLIVSAGRFSRTSGWKSAYHLLPLLLLAPAIDMAMGESLASFTTDVPRTAVRLATVALMFRWLVRERRDMQREAYDLACIVTLCAASVAIKLSAVIFSVALIATASWLWLKRRPRDEPFSYRAVGWPLAIGLAFGGAWIARGIVLSGYPMFPSPVLPAPVAWRVLAEHARAEFVQVGHTSRATYDNVAVMSGRETGIESWLPHWIDLLWADPYYVLFPLVASLLALPFVVIARRVASAEARQRAKVPLWIIPTTMIAIAVWFFVSPEPRYAVGPFWTLTALLWTKAAVLSGWLDAPARKRLVFIAACAVGVSPMVINPVVDWFFGKPSENVVKMIYHANVKVPPKGEWYGPVVGRWSVRPYTTHSGLVLNVPRTRCFDAPVPCTPNPAPNLRLRVPGRIDRGFVVDGSWQMINWPEPWRPAVLPAFREAWSRH